MRSEQFDDAVAALARAGHHRRFPQPRPGFDRRFSKGTSFVTDEGTEIDLHRTFAMGPFGLTMKLDDLWARASTFRVGGVDLHALGREERFLHTCFHASLGDNPPRLLTCATWPSSSSAAASTCTWCARWPPRGRPTRCWPAPSS